MTLKQYVTFVGAITLAEGIMGTIGITGPTAANSPFGNRWYFDPMENLIHTIYGIAGIVIGLWYPEHAAKYAWAVIIATGAVGLLSAFSPVPQGIHFLGAQLQNPTDTILHLFFASLSGIMLYKHYKQKQQH